MEAVFRFSALILAMFVFYSLAPAAQADDGFEAYGRGDFATALKLWTPAANAGDQTAAFNVGVLYFYGKGVEKDHAEAAKWYERAALKGNDKAQSALGIMYSDGDGVERDLFIATKWLQLAAEQFDRAAATKLHSVEAEQLDLIAQKILGRPGSTVPKPERLKLAAEHGDIYAENQMAYKYVDGIDVAKDDVEAVKWYRTAAEQGDPTGQYNLGMMYVSNRGVPPVAKGILTSNEMMGYTWLLLAARQGHAAAATVANGFSNTEVTFSAVQLGMVKDAVEQWKPTAFQEPSGKTP